MSIRIFGLNALQIILSAALLFLSSLSAQAEFFWSGAISASGNTATGSVAGQQYSITSTKNIMTSPRIDIARLFPDSYKVPGDTGAGPDVTVFREQLGGSYTLTFSQPVEQPIIAISSLGNPRNPIVFNFGAPVEILWSDAITFNEGSAAATTSITGREGYVIARYSGTVSQVTFSIPVPETFMNLIVGFEVTATTPQITGPSGSAGDTASAITINENTAAVTRFTANKAVNWTISGGADAALFSIAGNSGAITFNSAPDFEAPGDAGADNDYVVEVTATDLLGATTRQTLTVTVADVNDNAVVITGPNGAGGTTTGALAAITVEENQTAVTSVSADKAVTWSLAGADADRFSISTSGVITFNATPDFEAPTDVGDGAGNNTYVINVTATYGGRATIQTLTVAVADVDDSAAVISGPDGAGGTMTGALATITVEENQTAVATFSADKAVTWSLAGADANRFSITTDGVITFNAPPDFEAPGDAAGNSTYVIDVTATDNGGRVTVQTLSVTIADVWDSLPGEINSIYVDSDSDGVSDVLESSATDRDGDGISDAADYDPQGYFYCQEDGRILTGGGITVTGPNGSNSSVGIANGIRIVRDGSSGEYQWFAQQPGTYTMAITYPTGAGIPSQSRVSGGTIDLTTLLPSNPASIGSSEFGATRRLADASAPANSIFYTTFQIEAGDPNLIGNNIPMEQCADNRVTISTITNGSELNSATPTNATFTIEQGRLSSLPTVVGYSVGGTATSGADFTTLSGSVTIPAGETTATIVVPILEDRDIEGTETIAITLTAITSGDLTTTLGTISTGTATLTDDDSANIVVTNVDLVTNEGGNDDATMTFALLGAPTAPVTLGFTGDSQCSVAPASITFTTANFDQPQTLVIRAIDDAEVEAAHSCQPTAKVSSADGRFDGTALPLSAVTITDDLVDQVRYPLTQILEDEVARTIRTQQQAFNSMSKGALGRLQARQDMTCGTLQAFDVDGALDVRGRNASTLGTFGSDAYNCATNTREILDGSFSINTTENTGLQAALQFSLQRERSSSDRELSGYFLGGYFSQTEASGTGDGAIYGIGVNGGFYGARSFSEGVFMDYYLAAATGQHAFDIAFQAASAQINTTGDYGYLASFVGLGFSGQREFDNFMVKPRVAVDLAYAIVGDADISARQLGLNNTGTIEMDAFNGGRVMVETSFENLSAPDGSETMASLARAAIAPRFLCAFSSYDDRTDCGIGLGLAWERSNSASGLVFGIEVDAERTKNNRNLALNVTRKRPIADDLGTEQTRLSISQGGTVQAEYGLRLDF